MALGEADHHCHLAGWLESMQANLVVALLESYPEVFQRSGKGVSNWIVVTAGIDK